MHKKVDIRRNDQVKVITGRGKNLKGGRRVLAVFPDEGKVLVEGVRMVKKHVRPSRTTKGGIAEQESPINVSNLVLVCPNCGPAKVGYKVEGDTRVRVCKKCGQTLPTKK